MKVFCEQRFENFEELSNYIRDHKIKKRNIQSINISYTESPMYHPIILTFLVKQKRERKPKNNKILKEIAQNLNTYSLLYMIFPAIPFAIFCMAESGIGMAVFGLATLFFFLWSIISSMEI